MSAPTRESLLAQLRAERAATIEPETSIEWGVRVDHPRLDGFTSAVTSEAHADRLLAQANPGTTVTKLRRHVTDWEAVPTSGGDAQ